MKDRHRVVSREDWLRERTEFLAKEKELTRARDELNRQRRELPWEAVHKEYRFEGLNGEETLADLFEGCSQLIVYHFMFGPEWGAGCANCSFWADNFNGIPVHLNHRDVSFVAVSRAPLDKLVAYQKRMGWEFKWVSSFHSDFNRDFYVGFTAEEVAQQSGFYNYRMQDPNDEEREGLSVFYHDNDGQVFHTYSAYARGIDMVNGAYHFLDLVPKGRDEAGHVPPPYWVRRHDEY